MRKIRRCSTPEAIAVDALSKNDEAKFRSLILGADLKGMPIPKTVLEWITHPKVDSELGRKIVTSCLGEVLS